MTTAANLEKLKDAYAIIDGIPEKIFDLEDVIAKQGKTLECGTIACGLGWLTLHPTFFDGVYYDRNDNGIVRWEVNGKYTNNMWEMCRHTLNLGGHETTTLFDRRGHSKYDASIIKGNPGITDKQLFLTRLKTFIQENEQ